MLTNSMWFPAAVVEFMIKNLTGMDWERIDTKGQNEEIVNTSSE